MAFDDNQMNTVDNKLNRLPPSYATIQSLVEDVESSPIIIAAVHSNSDNAVKQQVFDKIGKSLASRYNGNETNFKIVINERLSNAEVNLLTSQYPSVDFTWTHKSNHGHAFASASRRVELNVLLQRVNCKSTTLTSVYGNYDALVTDIGGNFPTHVTACRKNVHSCSPIIDVHDSNRFTNRYIKVCDAVSSGKITDIDKYDLVNKCIAGMSGASNAFMCQKKFQNCTVKTPYAIALHSIYDLSLDDIALGMQKKDILTLFGTFVYSDRILLQKKGRLHHLQMSWSIDDKHIEFYFDDSTAPYRHSLDNYFKFLGVSHFCKGGVSCYVEMMENVDGVQYFKINRLIKPYLSPSSYNHRIALPYFKGKVRIEFTFRDDDYNNFLGVLTDSLIHEPTIYEPYVRDVRTSTRDFSTTVDTLLSRACELYPLDGRSMGGTVCFVINEELAMKALTWACNASDKRFTPMEVFSYIRSLASTTYVGTTVVKRYDESDPIKQFLLAQAVYIYAYQFKYKVGIEVAGHLAGIAYNRKLAHKGIVQKLINKYMVDYDSWGRDVKRMMPNSLVGSLCKAWSDSLTNSLRAEVNYNVLITVPEHHLVIPVKVPSSKTSVPVIIDTSAVSNLMQAHVKPVLTGVLRRLHSRIPDVTPTFDVDTFNMRYPGMDPVSVYDGVVGKHLYYYPELHQQLPSSYARTLSELLSSNKRRFYFPVYYDCLVDMSSRTVSLTSFDVNDVTLDYYCVHAKRLIDFRSSFSPTELTETYKALVFRNTNTRIVKTREGYGVELKRTYLAELSDAEPRNYPFGIFDLQFLSDSEHEFFLAGNTAKRLPLTKTDVVIDRAAAKLQSIDLIQHKSLSGSNTVLDLCSNPGGFATYITKTNPACTYTSVSAKGLPNCLPRKNRLPLVTYLDDGLVSCDLTQSSMQQYVVDSVGMVSLVLADGAVDVGTNYSMKSELNEPIILSEIKIAYGSVALGGSFLLKVYSFHSPRIPMLLSIMSVEYASVHMYKPNHSSLYNRERYLYFHSRQSVSPFPSYMLSLRDSELGSVPLSTQSYAFFQALVGASADFDAKMLDLMKIDPEFEVVIVDDRGIGTTKRVPSAPAPTDTPDYDSDSSHSHDTLDDCAASGLDAADDRLPIALPSEHNIQLRNKLVEVSPGLYRHPKDPGLMLKLLRVPGDGDCCYHSMFKGSAKNSRFLFELELSKLPSSSINDCLLETREKEQKEFSWGSMTDISLFGMILGSHIGVIVSGMHMMEPVDHYVYSVPGHYDATVNVCELHSNGDIAYPNFDTMDVIKNFYVHDGIKYFVPMYVAGCVVCVAHHHSGPKYIFPSMSVPPGYYTVHKFEIGQLVVSTKFSGVKRHAPMMPKPISRSVKNDPARLPLPTINVGPVGGSESTLSHTDTTIGNSTKVINPPPNVETVSIPSLPKIEPKLVSKKPVIKSVDNSRPDIPKAKVHDVTVSIPLNDDSLPKTEQKLVSKKPVIKSVDNSSCVADFNLRPDIPKAKVHEVTKPILDIPMLRMSACETYSTEVIGDEYIVTLDASSGLISPGQYASVVEWLKNFNLGENLMVIRSSSIDLTILSSTGRFRNLYVYTMPGNDQPLPAFYPDDYRRNAMLEQRYIWATDDHRTKIECQLFYNEVSNSGCEVYKHNVESGRGAFTVNAGVPTWILQPSRDAKGWMYAYDGVRFVNIEGLIIDNFAFDSKYSPPDGAYVITRNTGVMINTKLYDAVKDYDVNEDMTFKIHIVEGVPGGGKTQYIVDEHNTESLRSVVATATRDSANNLRERVKKLDNVIAKRKYRTLDSLLVNVGDYVGAVVDDLWVDEAMMKHFGMCLWAASVLRVKRLILCGDKGQIGYFSNTDYVAKYAAPDGDDVKYLNVSYRIPMDAAYCLSGLRSDAGIAIYPDHVMTTNKILRSFDVRSYIQLVDDDLSDYQVLTFTQDEKNALISKYPNVRTIGEYQGKQSDRVAIIRSRDTNVGLYSDMAQIVVALSRHKISVVYYSVKEDKMFNFMKSVMRCDNEEIRTAGTSGGAYVFNSALEFDNRNNPRLSEFKQVPFYELRIKPDYVAPLHREDQDLVRLVYQNMNTGYVHIKPRFIERDLFPVFNEVVPEDDTIPFCSDPISVVREYIRAIKPGCDVRPSRYCQEIFQQDDQYLGNVSYRQRDVQLTPHTNDAMTPLIDTPMLPPFENTIKGVLKTFNERNGDVPLLAHITHVDELSDGLVSAFKTAYIKDLKLLDIYTNNKLTVNIDTITEWLRTQSPDVIKHIRSTESFTIMDKLFPGYTYMLKRNAKPNLDDNPQDKFSSPQAIVFPEKIYNYVYCPMVRDMKHRLYSVLRDDKLLFSDIDIVGFEKILNARFPTHNLRNFKHTCELDFSKYDKSQNIVSLLFEIKMMELLGVSKDHIAAWLVMHLVAVATNRPLGLSFLIELQRKSGDAMTWLGNTLFLMAVVAMVVGPHIMVGIFALFSGDDNYMFSRVPIDIRMAAKLAATLFNLELKIMNYKTPYFCSKFLLPTVNGWKFIPDLWKLIIKLGRRDMVSDEHVEQYRRSLSDTMVSMNDRNVYHHVSTAMRDRYKIDFDCDHLLDNLRYLVSRPAIFAQLYYWEFNDSPARYTVLPDIDI